MRLTYLGDSYEMVKEGFAEPYLDDGRHPRPEVVKEILELFGKYYLPREEGEEREEEPRDKEKVNDHVEQVEPSCSAAGGAAG